MSITSSPGRPHWLHLGPEVAQAIAENRPVVVLESTLMTHGLPWPDNLATVRACEQAVRDAGAIPATIAVLAGELTVGLTDSQLAALAERPAGSVRKASQRDLASAVVDRATAGTTVSATMTLAHLAGLSVFATGGIGGAHLRPEVGSPFDISADLTELSRTPVMVVCAGAKSILDLDQTLELLETFNVPVVGYQTDEFPTFTVKSSAALRVSARVDDPAQAARLFQWHRRLLGRGMLLAQAVDEDVVVSPVQYQAALEQAEAEAKEARMSGPRRTPFVLARLADLTAGQTLSANRALIIANARLAASVARAILEA